MIALFAIAFAVVLFVLAFEKPKYALFVFIILDITLPTYFSTWNYFPLGVNIYFLDIASFSLLFSLMGSNRLKLNNDLELDKNWIYWIIYAFIAVFFSTFIQNHSLNNVIGFSRRYFIYPLICYYIVVNNLRDMNPRDTYKLWSLVLRLPAFTLLAHEIIRYLLGTSFYNQGLPTYDFATDFRGASPVEALAMFPAFHYSFNRVLTQRARIFSIDGLVIIVGFIAAIMCGFRKIPLTLVITIAIHLLYLLRYQSRRTLRAIRKTVFVILIIALIFTVLGIQAVPGVVENQFAMMKAKFFSGDNGSFRIEGIAFRYTLALYTWRSFIQNPILGQGLGYESVWVFGGELQNNDPHNLILSIAVRLGIIGVILLGIIFWKFFFFLNRQSRVREIQQYFIPVLLFFLAYILNGMISAGSFGPHGVSMLSIFMGMSYRLAARPDVISYFLQVDLRKSELQKSSKEKRLNDLVKG
ncbi:O-antigen ligase family protein [bacterium]|nr:O-antigen ligase family protein [bacterium]